MLKFQLFALEDQPFDFIVLLDKTQIFCTVASTVHFVICKGDSIDMQSCEIQLFCCEEGGFRLTYFAAI